MESDVFGLPSTKYLPRTAQSCIRTSSPALRQWCGKPATSGPDSTVWPHHTSSIWPLSGMSKVRMYGRVFKHLMSAFHVLPTCESVKQQAVEEQQDDGWSGLPSLCSIWLFVMHNTSLKQGHSQWCGTSHLAVRGMFTFLQGHRMLDRQYWAVEIAFGTSF